MADDSVIASMILDNAERARNRWGDRWKKIDEKTILTVLMEEVGELASAVLNKHEHPPEYELIQIGGIVHNWLRIVNPEELMYAYDKEKEKHP